MAGENLQEYKIEIYKVGCYKGPHTTRVVWCPDRDLWTRFPESVLMQIRRDFPFLYNDFSKTIQAYYHMNHCERCGAKMGDWYLATEELGCINIRPIETKTYRAKVLRAKT